MTALLPRVRPVLTGLFLLCLFCLPPLTMTAANAQVGHSGEIANPNRASVEQLTALPHLDSSMAAALIAARPLLSMSDLDRWLAKELSAAQRAELYAELFIPINLNTASRAEILMVPGVGPRMAHEFEEYRPYRALAQFRREIGKYVDDDELARLEAFVFVPIDLNSASDEAILSIPGLGERMLHEFKEYRPYASIEQFRREIGKYVDDGELARLERYVTLEPSP